MSESTNGIEPTIGYEPNLSPDIADVEPLAPKRRPVSRIVTVAACTTLIAGVGGFLIGRTSGSSTHPSSAITASANDAAGSVASTPIDRTEGSVAAPPSLPFGASSGNSKMAASRVSGGGQYSQGAYQEPALELVVERTTADGITLRAHRQDFGIESQTPYPGRFGGEQFGGWKPAGWCFPTGQLRISIVTSRAANLSGASLYSEPKGGVAVSTFAAGYVEASPTFGAVVQVGADITSVTFTTARGLSDTTTPTKGVALLAVNGPIEDSFTVTLKKADGSETRQTSTELASQSNGDEYRTACEPPPPVLPPAGAQPVDPTAAEVAVRESWKISRDFGGTAAAVRLARIDDPTGIEDAWKSLNDGQFGDVAKTSTASIKDFVFTSPTEAWFRYDIVTSITNFSDRYGVARLGDDGVWRVTRQTVCQDLSLAPGNQCSPPVENLLPPSALNDPRYAHGVPTPIGEPIQVDPPVSIGAPIPPKP